MDELEPGKNSAHIYSLLVVLLAPLWKAKMVKKVKWRYLASMLLFRAMVQCMPVGIAASYIAASCIAACFALGFNADSAAKGLHLLIC